MTSYAALKNLGLAALASLTVGGCYYGDVYSASYAGADCSSRYGDSYWSNDPYAYDDGYYGYDCYDAADYGSGFVQIGFGGGWYQQLYYPGYGLFLFDRFGRRHNMSHDYLTYWGGRRAWWKHHGHRSGHNAYRHGGEGHRDGRRPGRGYGHSDGPFHGSSDGNWSNGPASVPAPRARPRNEGWRGRPRNDANGGFAPGAVPADPVPGVEATPPPPRMRRGGFGGAGVQGNRNWTPNDSAPVGSAYVPQPRAARMPREVVPSVGSASASDVEPRMAPARSEPGYSPPPPPARPHVPRRDAENAERED